MAVPKSKVSKQRRNKRYRRGEVNSPKRTRGITPLSFCPEMG